MKVSIRPYELDDAGALLEAALESVSTVGRWLPWCHDGLKLADLRGWIESEIELRAGGRSFEFVIQDEGGRLLGGCGINHVDAEHRVANLSYWIRPTAAGRGVATRAAKRVLDWTFAETELERVEVLCEVDNAPSQRVAEKLGALREGLLRSRFFIHGEPRDVYVYSVIRSD